MSKTAPEITEESVEDALKDDDVVEAGNYKEWMYVIYDDVASKEDMERVESQIHPRLEREEEVRDPEEFEKRGLEPSRVDENCMLYFLLPSWAEEEE